MCGIAGHFGPPVTAAVRARMLDALRARGPDAQHIVTFDGDGNVGDGALPAVSALVHARLSIIDPRPQADQPMASDDRTSGSPTTAKSTDGTMMRACSKRAARSSARGRDTEFILRAYEA